MNHFKYSYEDSAIAFENLSHSKKIYDLSIFHYLNSLCLKNGSSLEGRKKSFSHITKQKKFVPVLVKEKPFILWFPTSSSKDYTCVWVAYHQIQKISYTKQKALICFYDGEILQLEHPKRIKNILTNIFVFQAALLSQNDD